MKRLFTFLTIIALIAAAGVAAYIVYQQTTNQPLVMLPGDEHFACVYPNYSKIHTGMKGNEVSTLLKLEPSQKIVKDNLSDYYFGQGDLESKIKSGWMYTLPSGWTGDVEIYLDANDTVVGKNCGEG